MKRQAPTQYSQSFMQELLNDLNAELTNRYMKRARIDLDPTADVVMTSPDGTRYSIKVANGGTFTFTVVT